MAGKWEIIAGMLDGEAVQKALADGWEPFGFAMVAMAADLAGQTFAKPVVALRLWVPSEEKGIGGTAEEFGGTFPSWNIQQGREARPGDVYGADRD